MQSIPIMSGNTTNTKICYWAVSKKQKRTWLGEANNLMIKLWRHLTQYWQQVTQLDKGLELYCRSILIFWIKGRYKLKLRMDPSLKSCMSWPWWWAICRLPQLSSEMLSQFSKSPNSMTSSFSFNWRRSLVVAMTTMSTTTFSTWELVRLTANRSYYNYKRSFKLTTLQLVQWNNNDRKV